MPIKNQGYVARTEGCIGMFYWEPTWTALDSSTLRKGTGRATTYSNDYTGVSLSSHEGTAFDNQTLFNENGGPLAALKFYVDYVNDVGLTRHSWDEGTVTIAATCTENGVKVYTCSDCGQTKIEIIGATGHTYGSPSFTWFEDYSTCTAVFTCENDSTHVETETCDVDSETTYATCTEDGKTVYTATCTFNGTTYTGTKTVTNESATWHDYVAVVTAPTCTEGGYTTYTCTVCGDSYTADETAATGHDWDVTYGWSGDYSTCTATFTCQNDSSHVETETCEVKSTTTGATCTTDGKTVYTATCTFDGTTYTNEQTVAIPATGHTKGEAVIENNVAATCTADGSYDSVVYCSVCGEELSRETVTVTAAGHDYVATTTIDPTCTTGGYTTYTCSVCGDTYTADETEAKGHTAGESVIENEVEATCTTNGSYDEVVYCTMCNDEISRETIKVDATGHTAGETVIENVVDATCTMDGSYDEVVYCTVCGEEVSRKTVTIDAKGHTEGEAVIENVVDATCTEDGYTGDTVCTVCGETVKSGEVIPATGHSYESVITEPTASEGGYTTHTCTVCGDSYIDSETDPTGYTFVDVPETEYYAVPVYWAVDNGIIKGTSDTTFSPLDGCLRCDVVMILWRAAGEPSVSGVANPFTDVNESDYFYEAVLWAVSEGITTGTTATTFGPYDTCERCQVVTFLWRAAGEPSVSGAENPFADVKESDYFYEAVIWAVSEGVTNGTSLTTFSPIDDCLRCEVVTFLYRYYGASLSVNASRKYE